MNLTRHWSMLIAVHGMAAIALGGGCRPSPRSPPELASLKVRIVAHPHDGYDPGPRPDLYADAPATTASARGDYGDFERVNYHDLEEVVVWLEPRDAGLAAPPSVTVEIEIPQFATAVVAPLHVIGVGGMLRLRNDRDTVATVYSVSDANEFSLEAIAVGGTATHAVNSAGDIELNCEGLVNPIARIMVVPTAWFRPARGGGNVLFEGLPPGTYTVACRHPRLPGDCKDVQLVKDQQEWIELTVGVRDLPGVP